MAARVFLDLAGGWAETGHGAHRVAHAGPADNVAAFLAALPRDRDWDLPEVLAALAPLAGSFAFIAAGPARTWAIADRVRGYPVFWTGQGGFAASNSARRLAREAGLAQPDPAALAEMRQAGYVTGPDTALAGLRQLQAGELAFCDAAGPVRTHRYFRFFSTDLRRDSAEELLAEHGRRTEVIFRRVAERAGGRPIWVPLSGGLDSRLILCKLHELGYPQLRAFSYGSPGNHEAKAARHVAEVLGVPWLFVPCPVRACRAHFAGPERRAYADFSDGLCSVPNYMDLYPLSALIRENRIPPDAVLMNGQSGDFTTGGHIPPALQAPDAGLDQALAWIEAKHLTLWTDAPARALLPGLRARVGRLLEQVAPPDAAPHAAARRAECWEWQERQCKFVINGQRIYDFLGFAWELPLWHEEYLEFWRGIPVPVKAGQRLYVRWLEEWDYRGLFRGFKPTVWRWPGASMGLLALAQAVGLLGRGAKTAFYDYAKYFGHYRSQYGVYPYAHYRRLARVHRNPYSFYALTWLAENPGLAAGLSDHTAP